MVEAREVEAISFECSRCHARVEVPWDGAMQEGASCPGCGSPLTSASKAFALFRELFDDVGSDSGVRFRVRRLSRPGEPRH